MYNKLIILVMGVFFLSYITIVSASQSTTAPFHIVTGNVSHSNLTINAFSNSTCLVDLIYNETFIDKFDSGEVFVVAGENSTVPLNLSFNEETYFNFYANNDLLNFSNSSEIGSNGDTTCLKIRIGQGQIGSNDINVSEIQQRIDSTCAVGSSVRVINDDGTVTCEVDTDTQYTHLTNFTDDLNYSNKNVNSSDYWDNFSIVNTTQIEENGGVLNILESWLIGVINTWLSGKTTDDLTQGTTNFYDNQTFNQSLTDDLYNYTNGTGINLTGTQFSHSDTSSQASSDNSGNSFIQDIVLDTFGHLTSLVVTAVDFSGVWSALSANRTEIESDIVANRTASETTMRAERDANITQVKTDLRVDIDGNATALRTDIDGNFSTLDTKIDGVNTTANIEGLNFSRGNHTIDTDTTYTNGTGIILVGTQFNHSDTSSQASSDNSGNSFIQDIILDGFGHITSLVVTVFDFSGVWTALAGNRTEIEADIVANRTASETALRVDIDGNFTQVKTDLRTDIDGNASALRTDIDGNFSTLDTKIDTKLANNDNATLDNLNITGGLKLQKNATIAGNETGTRMFVDEKGNLDITLA